MGKAVKPFFSRGAVEVVKSLTKEIVISVSWKEGGKKFEDDAVVDLTMGADEIRDIAMSMTDDEGAQEDIFCFLVGETGIDLDDDWGDYSYENLDVRRSDFLN